jgi:tricorn protease
MSPAIRLSFSLAILALTAVTAGAKQGYLRYPDTWGERVVFTAEGDLWTANLDGRDVRRITTHPGDEILARFSPDGRWIAFAGDYDGNRDLFVIPAEGGEPRRLTWHPAQDEPLGWTPDGRAIIFRSLRENPLGVWEIFTVPVEGGEPEKLPIGRACHFAIDPASGLWAFNRTDGGGTWKRYRGGTAADIWVGDPQRGDFRKVTDFAGNDLFPMFHQGRIWFLSDQGGTVNIWSIKPDGGDRQRHTAFGAWDANWPSMGPTGRIVFMLAGDIHLFDPVNGSERAIPIDLPSERVLTRTRYPNPSQYLTEWALAPDGDRLAIEARGEIFSVPVKEGVTLPVTHGSGAREGRLAFDPEGKRLAYVTDASGEEAIVTADAWGRGDLKTITPAEDKAYHFQPVWSPDGKWIAYADQTQSLYLLPAAGGERRTVDHCEQEEIHEYAWSPDGRWLAYTKYNANDYGDIFIYDTQEQTRQQVTGWSTDDRTPAWDPQGRYLYFLSDRTMNPMLGAIDFDTIEMEPSRVYALLLRRDVENPLVRKEGLPPKDGGKEEAKKEGKGTPGKDGSADEKSKAATVEPVKIDFDGLADRVIELPTEAGRYYGLAATDQKIFLLSWPAEGLSEEWDPSEEPQPKGTLIAFDWEKREAKPFLSGVAGFDLQAKAGKILVRKGRDEFYLLDAGSPPGDDLSDARVKLDDLVIELDPREEWRQIFFEGWRSMRDFYWAPEMAGLDWAAIRDQYATLLPRIATREELRDLMAEMIGELSTSHTYVWGGDPGMSAPHHGAGLLGAVLRPAGDAFRVERIYRGDAADRVRAPLLEPGSGIREGDYVLAVDHLPFAPGEPYEARLENLSDKEVVLTVNDRPDAGGAREVVVRPLDGLQEYRLRYADWVRRNREYVAEKTAGRIGYLHIPDMQGRGLVAFDTWFYPQLAKEGLVIDARYNGGGFVSQLILYRLMRRLLWWDRGRFGGVWTYPARVLNGPFVVLINEHAGSDGDIFPSAIQEMGLAPVIGKRTWGGVIGIRNLLPLVDQGILTHPSAAAWHPRRGWMIEGHGVDPDIEVENLPQDDVRGVDDQLDRGIEEVLRLHQEHPPLRPEFGPAPDKSRKAYQRELPAQ